MQPGLVYKNSLKYWKRRVSQPLTGLNERYDSKSRKVPSYDYEQ